MPTGCVGRGSLILGESVPGVRATSSSRRACPPSTTATCHGRRSPSAVIGPTTEGGFTTVPPLLLYPPGRCWRAVSGGGCGITPNVDFLTEHDVVDVTATPAHDRVTGARVVSHAGGGERALEADLVVDATGRAARTPAVLEGTGYGRPAEEKVTVLRRVFQSAAADLARHTARDGGGHDTRARPPHRAWRCSATRTTHGCSPRSAWRVASRPARPPSGWTSSRRSRPACDGRAAERRAADRDLPVPVPRESMAALRQDEALSLQLWW